MTDYSELVKALRFETDYVAVEKTMRDAADAIEELQAELKELCDKKREFKRACGLIVDEPMQMPKRGEWEETDMGWDGDIAWVCSVCGEPWTLIAGTPKENNMNYCPNCGAKMMEVQDGQ